MKRLLMILAGAVLVLTANTGCDNEFDFGDGNVYSVDNIPVKPGEWKEVWDRDEFGEDILLYKYCDLPIRELTWEIINGGTYTTYFYLDPDERRPVTKPLPYTEYLVDGGGYTWEFTLDAEYSEGKLRIKLMTSDFRNFTFDNTQYFRLAIMR